MKRLFIPAVLLLLGWLMFHPLSAAKTTAAANPGTATDLRLKHFSVYQEMKAASAFKELKWQFLGPKNISGRCTDVAVVAPKGKNYTIYVATASAGVWRSVNEGTTWEPIFDQAPSTAIGDIALVPGHPEQIWVGTGEANIFRSSQAGCGIYKSLDGGKNWQHLGLDATYTIARIVVHPANPDIVYVAASGHEWTDNPDRGVYKTTDGGKTWNKVLYIDERTGAIDLVMDPATPDTLYAATWQRIRRKWNDPRNEPGYGNSGIHKSTDGGKTWKPINKGLPEARFRGRIGIDIAATKPNVLYTMVDNYEIARPPTEAEKQDTYGLPRSGIIKGATVFRSEDGGENWKQTSGLTPETAKYMERHSNTYGWVFGQIRVDPTDENTIYTMGLFLNVSNDGGKTFRVLRGMHVDHHGLWIDPQNPNYLVNTNDGGIVISYDRGKTWRQFTDNLPICQFFNVNYDMAQPFHVLGSMQDHGSFRAVVDLRRGRDKIPVQDFENTPGGEGSQHAVDPNDPDLVYSAGFYGTMSRTNLKAGDEGEKIIVPRTLPGEPRLRGQWLAPFILSPHNPAIVYLGMQYLFRSIDRGDTWERISPDLTWNTAAEMGDIPFHTLFTVSESPLYAGLVYTGSDDGRVHVTRDSGKTWQEIGVGLPARKWVSRIVASAYDVGTVYMTQNGKRDDDFTAYVWKSTDFGKSWKSIAANLPGGPVNVIREDPIDGNILYVGTDLAVYVSTDGGQKWQVLGGNLPTTYVHDLVIHPRDNVIVIATHGRGMWVLDAQAVNKGRREYRWWDDEAGKPDRGRP